MDQRIQSIKRNDAGPQSSPNVDISAQNGSQVTAVILVDSTVHGDININSLSAKGNHISCSQISAEYKKMIVDMYSTVEEYNSFPGVNIHLAERFVDLLMVQKHREVNERQQEIICKGQKLHNILGKRNTDEYCTTSIHQMFCPDASGVTQRTVILQGNSGNGKSFTVQKIMLDWACGAFYTEMFDFVFHLQCKELNESEHTNLAEILSCSINAEVIAEVLRSPGKLLFLIDGFDELRPSQNSSKSLLTDPHKTASVQAILSALLQRKMLPGGFLLVTTRSTAMPILRNVLKHPYRFIEILGFTEERVKEYFKKFFKDEDDALSCKAYEYVKANHSLFTACFIPVICWIICTYIKENGIDLINGLETSTSIYVHFVSTMLKHHWQDLHDPVQDLLMSLGQLAEKGIREKKVLFEVKAVNADFVNIPFLCKIPFRKRVLSQPEFMLSFVHLSFQEFFTALYYLLLDDEESQKKTKRLLHCEDGSLSTCARDIKLQHLPIIRFVCGLCNKNVSSEFSLDMNLKQVSPSIKTLLKKWILQSIAECGHKREGKVGEGIVFIFHCLYELHEEDFVKEAIKGLEEINLGITFLTTTDCWVLLYCLQCCQRIRNLNLAQCCGITADKLRMLQPALCRCEKLCLLLEELNDADVNDLVLALGEGNTLRYLRQKKGALSEHSMKLVLDTLNKQKRLGAIELLIKSISIETALQLLNTEVTSMRLKVNEDCDDSVCSSLYVSNSDGEFRMNIIKYSPGTPPSLSRVFLTCLNPEISGTNWKEFLQVFHKINSSSEICAEFEEHLSSLMCFLRSVNGLREIDLDVLSLNEMWFSCLLSIIQTCHTLHKVKVKTKKNINEECVCSSLSMARKDCDFMLKICGYSRPPTEPSLATIFLITPHANLSTTNWKGILQPLHKINHSTEVCAEFQEGLSSLLCFLVSVKGLREINLDLFRLTERWSSYVLSVIQTCPTLQTVKVSTDMWNGLLLEEGIMFLQKSQKRSDCTLTVFGMRCQKQTDKCTLDVKGKYMMDLNCNQNVKLKF